MSLEKAVVQAAAGSPLSFEGESLTVLALWSMTKSLIQGIFLTVEASMKPCVLGSSGSII